MSFKPAVIKLRVTVTELCTVSGDSSLGAGSPARSFHPTQENVSFWQARFLSQQRRGNE